VGYFVLLQYDTEDGAFESVESELINLSIIRNKLGVILNKRRFFLFSIP